MCWKWAAGLETGNVLSDLPARYLGVDPSLAMLDRARCHAAGTALVCASAQGLHLVEQVLDDPFLYRTSTSQFQRISEEAYAQAKKNIIDIIKNTPDANNPVTFVIDLPFRVTVGRIREVAAQNHKTKKCRRKILQD